MKYFLQNKDTGKYNQALAQVLDGISAKAALIKVRNDRRTTLLGYVLTGVIKALNVGYCLLVETVGKVSSLGA